MKKLFLLSSLGVLGVLSRHFLENRLGGKGQWLPIGTLTANLLGCFLAGALYQIIAAKTGRQELASIGLIGFCGGLTTFSGYALSSLNDIQNGQWARAAVYLALSPLLGVFAAFCGMKLYKAFC